MTMAEQREVVMFGNAVRSACPPVHRRFRICGLDGIDGLDGMDGTDDEVC